MNNILIVGEEALAVAGARRNSGSRTASILKSWQDFEAYDFGAPKVAQPVDVVVLHLEAAGAMPINDAVQLHKRQPYTGFVYVVDINNKKLPKQALTALAEPGVTWVSSTASDEELKIRLDGLLNAVKRSRKQSIDDKSRSPWGLLMPELHNAKSGRLDAACIAELFGIPLKTFAGILRRGYATVHKTPDAPALQEKLTIFLRIASALLRLAGSRDAAKVWLNTPNPDLEDNQTPIAAIEMGEQQIIAELLEDALAGQPG